jgi:hypothetical protein
MTKSIAISAPNPRISRALNKQEITGNDLAPVDTSNTNIPSTDSLPSLPNRKKRSRPITIGKRKLSYQLRYLFKALLQWKEDKVDYKISFATVHFDRITEGKFTKAAKGPVSAYGDRLSYINKQLIHDANFFFTLEKGKTTNKRLHAHILIAYHPDDFDTLKAGLKKGANTTGTGLKIQDTYILRHPARPGSFEYEALEVDEEQGVCSYDKDKTGNYFKELPVDAGSVDYMSKDLAKRVISKTKHPYYAPQSLTKTANQLWDEAYEKQKAL